MRKSRQFLLVLFLLLFTASAYAQTCVDVDDGGAKSSDDEALTKKAIVEYGITDREDVCLTSENGVSTEEGTYLREYFCSNEKRESKVYNCVDLGFDRCFEGACAKGTGNQSSGTQTTTTTTQTTPQSTCGNEIVEKDQGEECDPPGSICFGRSTAEYGICKPDCTCKIAKAALENRPPPRCGDGYIDDGEDCEEDSDCPDKHVCSSCSCVKQLTPEEIEEMKQQAKSKEQTTDQTKETDEADKTETAEQEEELPEVNLSTKNFSESPGIKATSGIAKFFKGLINWLANIFS